jgi:hypothetical protein
MKSVLSFVIILSAFVTNVWSQAPSRGYSGSQVFGYFGSSGYDFGPASTWYTYSASDDGILEVNTDGSTFNTILAVYDSPTTSSPSMMEQLRLLASNDNGGADGRDSLVRLSVTAGTTYSIAVNTADGSYGSISLNRVMRQVFNNVSYSWYYSGWLYFSFSGWGNYSYKVYNPFGGLVGTAKDSSCVLVPSGTSYTVPGQSTRKDRTESSFARFTCSDGLFARQEKGQPFSGSGVWTFLKVHRK